MTATVFNPVLPQLENMPPSHDSWVETINFDSAYTLCNLLPYESQILLSNMLVAASVGKGFSELNYDMSLKMIFSLETNIWMSYNPFDVSAPWTASGLSIHRGLICAVLRWIH